jgi:predicted NUDIX family NTP pyrophosphohydrolase
MQVAAGLTDDNYFFFYGPESRTGGISEAGGLLVKCALPPSGRLVSVQVILRIMPKISAGLLMYCVRGDRMEVLLVHPGGPFWMRKDAGAWSLPKGEVGSGEDALEAAKREFEEETGFHPEGEFLPLGEVVQKGGKVFRAWAFEGDCNPASFKSNTFTMEWPPRSGKTQEFPEIDRGEFFPLEEAKKKINPAQLDLIDALEQIAGSGRKQTS